MAQLAEQLICNQQVIGSIPIVGFSNLLLQSDNGFDIISKYGWIPERPKGADCKSVVDDFSGSNPLSPTIWGRHFRCLPHFCQYSCGFAGFLERKIQSDFP